MKLENFLHKYRVETRVKDEIEYRQVTISQYTGIKFRGKKVGSKIGRKRQFVVDLEQFPNTIMFTRQGLKDGAIGIAPKEVHNCIVTENMPTLSVNTDIIDITYLELLLKSNYFFRKINELTTVGSAQKSIHERDLLNLEVDIPSIEIQRKIADKIISKKRYIRKLSTEIQTQKQLISQLKQSILQEAIQGKLTQEWREQNPNIEPASELLKRIKAEKEKLIKEKKIKKEKPLSPITNKEIPFEIPESWEWCRLGEITLDVSYGTSQKATLEEIGIPVLRMGNISKDGKIIYTNLKYVQEDIKDLPRLYLKNGDLIFNRTNSFDLVGKSAVFNRSETYTLASYLIRVRFDNHINSHFIKYFINSNECRENQIEPQIAQQNGQANFNGTKLKNIIIPILPIQEQKAIVEKVESLMEKCNALEQEVLKSEQHANMLMQAVLKEAFEK